VVRGQSDVLFQEPQEGLPNRATLKELAEHQSNGFLNALVGILLQSLIFSPKESDRCRDD
jgi:hypothetical protein